MILGFIWQIGGTRILRVILKKENKVGRITLFHFKTYCIATAVKTGCY